jgi:hypothetical protein
MAIILKTPFQEFGGNIIEEIDKSLWGQTEHGSKSGLRAQVLEQYNDVVVKITEF